MTTSTKLLGLALVLMLLAFPLTSVGTDRDVTWLWWAGVAVLVLGALIPPGLRFVDTDGDTDGDTSGDTSGDTHDHTDHEER